MRDHWVCEWLLKQRWCPEGTPEFRGGTVVWRHDLSKTPSGQHHISPCTLCDYHTPCRRPSSSADNTQPSVSWWCTSSSLRCSYLHHSHQTHSHPQYACAYWALAQCLYVYASCSLTGQLNALLTVAVSLHLAMLNAFQMSLKWKQIGCERDILLSGNNKRSFFYLIWIFTMQWFGHAACITQGTVLQLKHQCFLHKFFLWCLTVALLVIYFQNSFTLPSYVLRYFKYLYI